MQKMHLQNPEDRNYLHEVSRVTSLLLPCACLLLYNWILMVLQKPCPSQCPGQSSFREAIVATKRTRVFEGLEGTRRSCSAGTPRYTQVQPLISLPLDGEPVQSDSFSSRIPPGPFLPSSSPGFRQGAGSIAALGCALFLHSVTGA